MIAHPRLAPDEVVVRSGTYRYAGCTRAAVWLVRAADAALRVDLAPAGDATVVTSQVAPFDDLADAMRWIEAIVADIAWDTD